MDPVVWHHRPVLRQPVLVAAFGGWNDAGDAATGAVRHLIDAWSAEPFAEIDCEDFHDFTEDRPTVRLVDGLTRRIEWPRHELFATRPGALGPGVARDAAFLVAVEPQLRWRTYCAAVTDVARQIGATLVVTLGALLADVPHTRPVHLTGTAHDPELAERLGLQRSRYEGPTGIVGVLHDALSTAGLASASLWASVPHYVGRNPSPPASLALVERTCALIGTTVDTTDLRAAAADYLAEVDDVVGGDEDALAYVRSLEAEDDGEDDLDVIADALAAEEELLEAGDDGYALGRLRRPEDEGVTIAGADELAAEVERFLRDQEGG